MQNFNSRMKKKSQLCKKSQLALGIIDFMVNFISIDKKNIVMYLQYINEYIFYVSMQTT